MDMKIKGLNKFKDELDEFKEMSQTHEDELDMFSENSASRRLNTFIRMKMNSTSSRMNSTSQLKKVLMFC